MIPTSTAEPSGAAPGQSAKLVVSRTLGTVVLALNGEIDGSGTPHLAAVLRDLIDGQGNLALVVDLGGARTLDHAAAEVLRTAARSLKRRGGCLALARPSVALAETLIAAELDDLVVDRRA